MKGIDWCWLAERVDDDNERLWSMTMAIYFFVHPRFFRSQKNDALFHPTPRGCNASTRAKCFDDDNKKGSRWLAPVVCCPRISVALFSPLSPFFRSPIIHRTSWMVGIGAELARSGWRRSERGPSLPTLCIVAVVVPSGLTIVHFNYLLFGDRFPPPPGQFFGYLVWWSISPPWLLGWLFDPLSRSSPGCAILIGSNKWLQI